MPLLSTSEVKQYLTTRNHHMSSDELHGLANSGEIKHYRAANKRDLEKDPTKSRRYYFPAEAIEGYADELGLISLSSSATFLEKLWHRILARRARTIRRRGSPKDLKSIIFPTIGIPIAVFLIILLSEGLAPSAGMWTLLLFHSSMLLIALWTALVLNAYAKDNETSKFSSAFLSVEGMSATLVASYFALNVAFQQSFEEYSGLEEVIELTKEKNDLTNIVEKLNGQVEAYANLAEGLPKLIEEGGYHVPSDLVLTISCFTEEVPMRFNYSYSSPLDDIGNFEVGGSSSETMRAEIKLTRSRGELLLFKGNSPMEGLIAATSFNNSSLLKPHLDVAITGKDLCEEPNYVPLGEGRVTAVLSEMVSKKNGFIDRHKSMYNLLGDIEATQDAKDVLSIGDELIRIISDTNSRIAERQAALEVLASVPEGWTMTDPNHGEVVLQELLKNDSTVNRQIFDKLKVAEAINRLKRTDYLCRISPVMNKAKWEGHAQCLEEIPKKNKSLAVAYRLNLARANLAILSGGKDAADQLLQVAEDMFTIGTRMLEDKRMSPSSADNIDPYNLSADAFVLASLAYRLSGKPTAAMEMLDEIDKKADDVVDFSHTKDLMHAFTKDKINADLARGALEHAYNQLEGVSFEPGNFSKIQKAINFNVDRYLSRGFQVLIETGTKDFESFKRTSTNIKNEIQDPANELTSRFPQLERDDVFALSPVSEDGKDDSSVSNKEKRPYRLQIAPKTNAASFTRTEACELASLLQKLLNYEVVPVGTGATGCSV